MKNTTHHPPSTVHHSSSTVNRLFDVYPLFDIEPVKGEGCYVYDAEGTRYLDFYGGHAVISVGHSHPYYVSKISEQLQRIGFYSNSVQNSLQVELAHKLTELSGCQDYRLFLCNSGAEANENALKLASFVTGKTKVISFKKGFHGRTSAAVNVTDNNKIKAAINTTFSTEFHEWDSPDTVLASLSQGDVCAVIIEGIQGIGGIYMPDKAFLEKLAEWCQQYGAVLILDEVQSGYGRSGHFFGFQHADIQPDIISIAKGMGNGFPIGGVLVHEKHKAKYGVLGSTFGGNHLACAAGIAVLDILKNENLLEHSAELGAYFIRQLKTIPQVKEVRGRGLMIGLDMGEPIKPLREKLLYRDKIFTGSSSDPNTIRLLPPLNITKNEVDYFIEKFKQATLAS